MTSVKYCRLCFGVGKKCRCSYVPHQTPSQASALWTPPTMSYMTMASSTKTTASSSVGRVPPLRYPPPGLPPVDPVPMDTLPAPTSEKLLTTAVVGRGSRGLRQPQTPTAPGLRQVQPTTPQQRMPAPGRHEGAKRPLTGCRFIHLDTPLGCKRPPPRQAPSLAPVRVMMRWPEGAKMPEVCPHPEGLKAETGEIDPPLEDLGNVTEASTVTILWTMSPTMWPQPGNETLPT